MMPIMRGNLKDILGKEKGEGDSDEELE